MQVPFKTCFILVVFCDYTNAPKNHAHDAMLLADMASYTSVLHSCDSQQITLTAVTIAVRLSTVTVHVVWVAASVSISFPIINSAGYE